MLDVGWPLTRAALFRMDAERAHDLTLRLLGVAPRLFGAVARVTMGPPPAGLQRALGPLQIPGPIGLAAGLDKNGVAIGFWPSLGFGFVEVGTVTAHPQSGNPKPRMFRLVPDRALLNRMGFNNEGSEALATRLRGLREAGKWPAVPVGVNVGKSKITPLDDAPADYVLSIERLRGLADYFTVNVSSPNTPGLRDLQDGPLLAALLPQVMEAATGTPVWLKLAPDLGDEALHAAVRLAKSEGLTGVIATNTTIGRPLLTVDPDQAGGLSGRPLWPMARDRIAVALEAAEGLPVIGVGGIERADQVAELLSMGCAAVQLYSSLIFQGPGLPSRLHRELAAAVSTDS